MCCLKRMELANETDLNELTKGRLPSDAISWHFTFLNSSSFSFRFKTFQHRFISFPHFNDGYIQISDVSLKLGSCRHVPGI